MNNSDYSNAVKEARYWSMEYDKLKAINESLLSALKDAVKNWDERMHGDIEVKKTYSEHEFWSPSASLISSEYIHQLREAIKLCENGKM